MISSSSMTRTSGDFGDSLTRAFHRAEISCNLHRRAVSITAVTGAARRWLDCAAMSTGTTMSIQPQASTQATLPHVLLVDDDPSIRELVTDYLSGNELRVSAVADGKGMQAILAEQVVDLVVLDLKLRGEDGMALARRLRDESEIPIVMLTGRSEEADRVMGLELGADDYLTKPFSPRELLARIRTILRRRRAEVRQGRPEGIRAYRFEGWELNLNTRRLTGKNGKPVPLTHGELRLPVVVPVAPQPSALRE